MQRILVTFGLAIGLAHPALAGSLDPVPLEPAIAPVVILPPSAPAYTFSGFYGGTAIGTGAIDLEGDEDLADDLDDLFDAIDDDDSAAYYQAHIGYNFVRNGFVFGPELAVFNGESEVGEDFTIGDVDASADAEVGFGVRLTGRGGYQFGRVMPYVALGATHMEIETDGDDLSDTGVAYGIGAEFLVTDQVVLGVEYMQNDFDDFDDSGSDVDYQTVSFRASFKF